MTNCWIRVTNYGDWMGEFMVMQCRISYPLVNVYITMENHNAINGKLTISMAIFNSYLKLPEGSDVV